MLIKALETKFNYLDQWHINKAGVRSTLFGKVGDKFVTVDNWYKDGKWVEKRFVVWDDNSQRIVNKFPKNHPAPPNCGEKLDITA